MRKRQDFHMPNGAPISGAPGTPIRVLYRG